MSEEPKPREYRISISLSESEALALSNLALKEMRDMKSQARYLLRLKLLEYGELKEEKVKP